MVKLLTRFIVTSSCSLCRYTHIWHIWRCVGGSGVYSEASDASLIAHLVEASIAKLAPTANDDLSTKHVLHAS